MNFYELSEKIKKTKNEGLVGIYPLLYSGFAAYPSGYYVNGSYKVYIDSSLKAETNPSSKKHNWLKVARV